MIINLTNPPYFLTFDPETRAFSEGVTLTPTIRSATYQTDGKILPKDLARLTVGQVRCSSSDWIEVDLSPSEKRREGAYVWVPNQQPGWTRVDFFPTTVEELARLYGPHPEGWVAERSKGIPRQLTETLSVIKSAEAQGHVTLRVVETRAIKEMFEESAIETATKILFKHLDCD